MWSLSYTFPAKFILSVVFLAVLLTSCSEQSNADNKSIALDKIKTCQFDRPVVSSDGKRRIALIIGVGQYKKESITDLPGPPEDAKRFYALLTDKNSYQFPARNVCLLLDEQATKHNVISAFRKKLIEPARKDDIVVFYYAGHGSQITDINHDEADNMDETFVLHDSRTDDILDFIDDEFNQLITQLYKKTRNIAIFLDSCNSGTATRGNFLARFTEPLILNATDFPQSRGTGDSRPDMQFDSMPGLVVFSAASDGTSALERSGRGIFTDAVLTAFAPASTTPKTYRQASRQIPALILARQSNQVPYFQGDLNQFIFSSEHIKKPHAWDITRIDNGIVYLSGPPLPGMGVGAELRVFPGNSKSFDTRDLKKSKGTLVIDSLTGLNAESHIASNVKGAEPMAAGDFAVLITPADQYASITVSLREASKPGGIPEKLAKQLKDELENNSDARQVVRFIPKDGDFELRYTKDRLISVIGPENRTRAQFSSAAKVIHNLLQHARQRAILQLQGEGGTHFINNQTLQVQLIPAKTQDKCTDTSKWQQAEPNTEQIIPLCHKWQIKVSYQKGQGGQPKLLIGGVVLSSDGSIIGLPYDGRTVALNPGETTVLQEIFQGQLPLDTPESVIIFGTQENNPVPWNQLTDISQSDTRGNISPLQKKIQRYLTLTRGNVFAGYENADTTTWTRSIVPMRVEANSRFLKRQAGEADSEYNSREYTIQNFNILPYLPDDPESPLYKVLQTADQLARASITDGYPYTQHDWSQGSDEKNLAKGIDCSRAIWFAFTRSGLKYNNNNRYITTREMASPDSIMSQEFDRCDNEPLQTGDVLVYRDDQRGDGHTVMVIDPVKRIAWGSHGWDGNAKLLKIKPDTGVEYQLIKFKKDWQRWDRKTMFKKACWRYRQFITEKMASGASRGYQSLKNYCKNRTCL